MTGFRHRGDDRFRDKASQKRSIPDDGGAAGVPIIAIVFC
jgi:hypothetical protein